MQIFSRNQACRPERFLVLPSVYPLPHPFPYVPSGLTFGGSFALSPSLLSVVNGGEKSEADFAFCKRTNTRSDMEFISCGSYPLEFKQGGGMGIKCQGFWWSSQPAGRPRHSEQAFLHILNIPGIDLSGRLTETQNSSSI